MQKKGKTDVHKSVIDTRLIILYIIVIVILTAMMTWAVLTKIQPVQSDIQKGGTPDVQVGLTVESPVPVTSQSTVVGFTVLEFENN